ncbi:alginate export family protein [Pontibacter silvestris]|uniref:Alginate export family protein n=1 Tax=Pontibacter silvestris TaxID=2305183 RepID=A0ABW4WZS2_9BACT|nr:alginate export family protein [Pontibacter silvestris]MCC9137473.1 alginate export family protein [Pontibacter silvestris]
MRGTSFRIVLLLAGLVLMVSKTAFGQFALSAEVRPRAELRDGFKSVRQEGSSAAFFIEQRSRLNADYQKDKLRMRLSLQDVRIWGATNQVYKTDPSLFNVYEAYGEYLFTPQLSIRVGRQELNYDNARFLGNLDWAQQGRSHDAFRLMYADSTGIAVHVGAAFNQNIALEPTKLEGTFYGGIDNYKIMQYVWLHKDIGTAKFSGLFFNDGRQRDSDSTVFFRQTYGILAEQNLGAVRLGGEFYFQGGKDPAGRTVRAYLAALNATYVTKLTPLTLGVDYLSGSDAFDTHNKAFTPLYGTNHGFYGFMDYFYVGNNHGQGGQTAGLVDVYFKTNFKLSDKGSLLAHLHHFESPSTVYALQEGNNKLPSRLGEEVDLMYNLNVSTDFNLKVGYSQLYATESMDALKGRSGKTFNQWAWLMLTFKPTLFKAM